jgi:hypothetical protein
MPSKAIIAKTTDPNPTEKQNQNQYPPMLPITATMANQIL